MSRNFSEINPVAYDLMVKAAESIFAKLEEEIPQNNLGCLQVGFGAIYINICNELRDSGAEVLEKQEFENFMNEYLVKDKRVFMRTPVKLPNKHEHLKVYGRYVYFNNLGEVYFEYADTYIARFVKKYLIRPLQNSEKECYYYMHIYDGVILDGPLFALQHFANYGEKENEEMLKKMKIVAKRFNVSLDLVPEYEIYSRSESADNLYFLLKCNVE